MVGGGGALGGALVRALLDAGSEVVVAGRTPAADARVRRSYVLDATAVDWDRSYAAIEGDTGLALDGVLFVSGTAAYGRTAQVPAERARAIFDLNFWACSEAARVVGKRWAAAGRAGTFGAVLSIVARRAVPFEAHYAASKAAAARFLECLDLEYAPHGIRFLAAFPGTLDTPFRRTARWYGITPPHETGGADVGRTAAAILRLVEGRRRARVIGWRERVVDLADRLAPGLYDRAVLRARVARALRAAPSRPAPPDTRENG